MMENDEKLRIIEAAIKKMESDEVDIDNLRYLGRSLKDIEAEGHLSEEISDLRRLRDEMKGSTT